ncbi:type IV secretion system protein [Pseudoxanthomonas winnipegensis]|jgi:type IV secretion system protein VirB8|uniref:Type IV secretion system protein n=1 Tax=Pseudoxanthomonas winnipegensis TaxID=2480810 RepID=A0ABY1WB66_9GAMM|nr:type IV secretion system protein [Pseudoxanthomonas winnipegensis]TAA10820.1 type IV secretion system protein [Pseudoxanthomonas winnipegensis]TAA18247.1 type IV secretion system protein [Pseudoxanthomonas winnipegensis]TAH74379.1 type IV secretion system protein [Pseudoxanthomonas winnipegensis]
MISRKKEETPKVKAAIQKAVNYELTIADMAKRSEKRAWQVATGAIVLSLVLAGGYFMLLPLKERTPFLVLVDPYSGNVQTSRLVSNVLDKAISGGEAVSRANVQRFVLARESYDWNTLSGRYGDWQAAYLMASPDVGLQFRQEYSLKNPESPINLYGKLKAIRVQLLSTTMTGSGRGGSTGTAIVRFQRSVLDKKTGVLSFLDNKLATLTFKYNNNLRLDDDQRIVNPLGFQVMSYKVDNDFVASPPSATTATADPDAASAALDAATSVPGTPPAGDAANPSGRESAPAAHGEAK